MKVRGFWLLCLVMVVGLPTLSHAATFMVQLVGAPRPAAQGVTEPAMARQLIEIESAILDKLFDQGFILSTFPCQTSVDSAQPAPTPEVMASRILEAQKNKARWLLVVDIRFAPPPPAGVPGLATAEYLIYNVADGTGQRQMLDRVPGNCQSLGSAIVGALTQYL